MPFLKWHLYRRVDSEVDQRTLESFVETFFTSRAYETGFQLVSGEDHLNAPQGTKLQEYISWAAALPEREPPSWLALPANSEQLLAIQDGQALLARLRKMRSVSDDEETVSTGTATTPAATGLAKSPTATRAGMQPSWMRTLQQTCESLMAILPASFDANAVAAKDGTEGPLSRFFARETSLGKKLLQTIRGDLQDLLDVCAGKQKQTNRLRELVDTITKGKKRQHNPPRPVINRMSTGAVPAAWHKYEIDNGMSLNAFVANFAARLAQLERIGSAKAGGQDNAIWLGGLFRPSGWITASRQQAAHEQGVSLEALQLQLDIGGNVEIDINGSYAMKGKATQHNSLAGNCADSSVLELFLQGATWTDAGLAVNDGSRVPVAKGSLKWLPKTQDQAFGYACPVYLNADRVTVLFTAALPSKESTDTLTQRGVCLLANA